MKKITGKPHHVSTDGMKLNSRRNYINLFLFSLLAIVFSSCTQEEQISGPSGEADGSDRKVVLRMSVPFTTSRPQTRAIDAAEENTIQTVDVLAFRVDGDGEYYDYSAIGYKTPGNAEGSSTQSFTVTVRANSYKQRFVTITNARTEVQQLIGRREWWGVDKETMLSYLEKQFGSGSKKWNALSATDYATFPMWGESTLENITNTTSELSAPVTMLRMLAKINVQLDKSVEGLTDMFKLKSVRVYNINTRGRIVPETNAMVLETRDNNPYMMVNAPSIPTDAVDYDARHLGPELYQDFSAPGEADVAIRGSIYLFETQAANSNNRMEATCLVVSGLYGDDTTESYYRLDFMESDKTTFRHILRNNQYIANIVHVKERGHPTAQEAFESNPGEMIADIGLEISDPMTGEILSEIVFGGEAEVTPEARMMDVNWTPGTADLSIISNPESDIAFPSGSGAPVKGTVPGGNGMISYTIQPPAFTLAETTLPDGDPFLEKASRVYFSITDEGSTVTRSVVLRQVCYNLLTDQEDYYILDGSTYSFNVRSNVAWRIKSVVESSPMLAWDGADNLKEGTTGGNNTAEGDALTFTVIDNPRSWGTIEVTFESEDTPGKFTDKTITLVFAARRVKLLGMALTNVYGYNPSIPSTSNYGIDSHTMLSAAINFGTLPTSTVITEGFEFIGDNLTGSESDATIQSYLDQEPDIVVLGYNLYISQTQAEMYLAYLQNGGTLIAFCEGNGGGVERLMQTVFEDTSISQSRINAAGAVYALPDTDDAVLNGLFGDLRGMQWGDDASQTCALEGLPLSEIEVYSTGEDISGTSSSSSASLVTAFKHNTYRFMWFGDGGFLSTYPTGSITAYPCKIDATTKVPIPYMGTGRGFGRGSAKYEVYNSQIFANSIAWAIRGE